eukprot:CAMPEP_0184534470 /NCGR_PEP_ID=MMETSP0198_2-20121128/15350_1 /TAXON_ID=1112570 /ORGANISM="Thraustochytrium sp., Strain LLF1b" /LENGTH=192 /DNA_ID=CAMNT_0026927401 /DNA_START=202 /DNA_END=780 /DNA_ORIENTATION=+
MKLLSAVALRRFAQQKQRFKLSSQQFDGACATSLRDELSRTGFETLGRSLVRDANLLSMEQLVQSKNNLCDTLGALAAKLRSDKETSKELDALLEGLGNVENEDDQDESGPTAQNEEFTALGLHNALQHKILHLLHENYPDTDIDLWKSLVEMPSAVHIDEADLNSSGVQSLLLSGILKETDRGRGHLDVAH